MRKALLLVPLLLLSLASAPNPEAIVRVETESAGRCSAFHINASKGLFLTASHCLAAGERAIIQNLYFEEVTRDGEVLVLRAPAPQRSRPTLKLGPAPKAGDPILNVGYAGIMPRMAYFDGRWLGYVEVQESPYDINSALSAPGMSGGPIVDSKGRVVSMVVGGSLVVPEFPIPVTVSLGVPYATIERVMKQYR